MSSLRHPLAPYARDRTFGWSTAPVELIQAVLSILIKTRGWKSDAAHMRLLNSHWCAAVNGTLTSICPHKSRRVHQNDLFSLWQFPRLTEVDLSPFVLGAEKRRAIQKLSTLPSYIQPTRLTIPSTVIEALNCALPLFAQLTMLSIGGGRLMKDALRDGLRHLRLNELRCCLRLNDLVDVLDICPGLKHLTADVYWRRESFPKSSTLRQLNALDGLSLNFQEHCSTLEFLSELTVLTSLSLVVYPIGIPEINFKMPYLKHLSADAGFRILSNSTHEKLFPGLSSLQLKSNSRFSPGRWSMSNELPSELQRLTILNGFFDELPTLPHLTSLALMDVGPTRIVADCLASFDCLQTLRLTGWDCCMDEEECIFLDRPSMSQLRELTIEINRHRLEWMQSISTMTKLRRLCCILPYESDPLTKKEIELLYGLKHLHVLGLSGVAGFSRSDWATHDELWSGLDLLVINISGALENEDYDIEERMGMKPGVKVEVQPFYNARCRCSRHLKIHPAFC